MQAGTTLVCISALPPRKPVRKVCEAGNHHGCLIKITQSGRRSEEKILQLLVPRDLYRARPVYAHFNNTLGNIGPIYVINVLDPSAGKHRKEAATTKALTFTGGRAEFASDKIILDTLTIAKNDSVVRALDVVAAGRLCDGQRVEDDRAAGELGTAAGEGEGSW